jgi:hypothetical protein
MRALIALAVEVFDLLDGPEPPDEAAPPRRFRRRRKASQRGGTAA